VWKEVCILTRVTVYCIYLRFVFTKKNKSLTCHGLYIIAFQIKKQVASESELLNAIKSKRYH